MDVDLNMPKAKIFYGYTKGKRNPKKLFAIFNRANIVTYTCMHCGHVFAEYIACSKCGGDVLKRIIT